MSRSRRHTPIHGITTAGSEKRDKQVANRSFRHRNRILLKKLDDAALFLKIDQVRTQCDMAKDGKKYFDPKLYPKLMRK